MASAGRILIMPKGSYDSSVTYEMLDLVKHNGTSWIAKKTSVGIEPSESNGEYWQNFIDFDETDYTNKRVPSAENNTVDPNITTLARVRTMHEHCPTPDTFYVIDTIFVDGTDGIYSKFQIARCEQNCVFIRSKPYDSDWEKWDEVAMGGGVTLDYDPSGLDYIEQTFNVGHPETVKMFANVVGSTELYVIGVNIVTTTESSVTVRFLLNKATTGVVSLRIGYSY